MAYPTGSTTWVVPVDLSSVVRASDITNIQGAVTGLETGLLATSTSTWDATAFAKTTSWSNINARLTNIERGLTNGVGVGAPYLSTSAAGTISTTSGVALTLTAGSGNTSNLLSTAGFTLSSAGVPKVSGNNVLYVNSTEYNTLTSSITTISTTQSNLPNPLLLAGM